MNLTVGPSAHHLYQLEDPGRVLGYTTGEMREGERENREREKRGRRGGAGREMTNNKTVSDEEKVGC